MGGTGKESDSVPADEPGAVDFHPKNDFVDEAEWLQTTRMNNTKEDLDEAWADRSSPGPVWEHLDPLTVPFLRLSAAAHMACGALTLLDVLPFKLPLIGTLQKHNVFASLFAADPTPGAPEATAGSKLYTLLGAPLAGYGALVLQMANDPCTNFARNKKIACQVGTVTWALASGAFGLSMKVNSAAACLVMALVGHMCGWPKSPWPGKNPFANFNDL